MNGKGPFRFETALDDKNKSGSRSMPTPHLLNYLLK